MPESYTEPMAWVRKHNLIEFYAWELFKSFWYRSTCENDSLINLTQRVKNSLL
jgi:hypothetical protein